MRAKDSLEYENPIAGSSAASGGCEGETRASESERASERVLPLEVEQSPRDACGRFEGR